MNSSNFRFTLDLHSIQSQYSIPAKVGDTGKTLLINLTDGGVPYFISNGCLAKLTIKRPGGTSVVADCPIRNNAVIEYKFDEKTCAESGIHNCDITLYSADGDVLGTPSFIIVSSERVTRGTAMTASDWDEVDEFGVAEAQRKVSEENRTLAENERAVAEKNRADAEKARAAAESGRSTSETDRNDAELARKSSEAIRQQAEQARRDAETERANSEAVRAAQEKSRADAETLRVQKDTNRDASIQSAVDNSNNAVAVSEKAKRESEQALEKANDAISVANTAMSQSYTTQTNLINLSAQVQGIGRSYVVPDFLTFVYFLRSLMNITLSEDRDGDGINETYNIAVSDLKTGDNIIISEQGVPDFWFEKNTARNYGTYTYKGTEYSLSAGGIGGAHILETDYTVIEGHAISASASAQRAEEAEFKAENHRTWASAYADEAKKAEQEASSHRKWCSDYATECNEAKNEINEKLGDVGDIGAALDELHAYAQSLVNGGAS